MRSLFFVLLFLLSFGPSFVLSDEGVPTYGLSTAEKFVARLFSVIETRNATALEKALHYRFLLFTCDKVIDKDEILQTLTRSTTKFKPTFALNKDSIFLSSNIRLKFSGTVSGVGSAPFEITMYYDQTDYSLWRAHVLSCLPVNNIVNYKDTSFKMMSYQKASVFVQNFVKKLKNAASSDDVMKRRSLITREFEYDNCRNSISRDIFARSLDSHIAAFSTDPTNFEDIGSSIRFEVALENTPIEFYLNKRYSELESGGVMNCKAVNSAHDGSYPKDLLVWQFNKFIKARDFVQLESIFTERFEIATCQGALNRTQFLNAICSPPISTNVSVSLHSTGVLGANQFYTATLTGVGPTPIDMEIYVVRFKTRFKYRSAKITSCSQKAIVARNLL